RALKNDARLDDLRAQVVDGKTDQKVLDEITVREDAANLYAEADEPEAEAMRLLDEQARYSFPETPYIRRTASDPVPTLYHGARAPITAPLTEGGGYGAGGGVNLFGPGFYSTDAPDIALGYKGKRPNSALYSVRWVGEAP